MNRDQQVAEAFVSLSDTFADDLDPTVLLDRLAAHCVTLVGADAAGVMIATMHGTLRIMSVSDDAAALADLVALQRGEGPCPDAFRTGRPVQAPDLSQHGQHWPHFVAAARAAGYTGAYAVPLRVHRQTIGALNVLLTGGRRLEPGVLEVVQALADVTAVSLVIWTPDGGRPQDILSRVQSAVSAKATVETAKGMLAEQHGLDQAGAHRLLLSYAKRRGERPTDVAQALVRRRLDLDDLILSAPSS